MDSERRRGAAIGVLAALVLWSTVLAPPAMGRAATLASESAAPVRPARYLAHLRQGDHGMLEAAAHTAAIVRVAAALPADGSRLVHVYATQPLVAVSATPAGLAALASTGLVDHLEPDVPIVQTPEPAVESGPAAPTGAAMSVPTVTGAGWTVAVIDSGVDTSHPYLAGKTSTGVDGLGLGEACFAFGSMHNADGDCPGGTTAASGPGTAAPCPVPGCEHGTHVAGIAVGNGTPYGGSVPDGAAPGASLYPIRVFSTSSFADECGSAATPCMFAYPDDVLAALDLLVVESAHYHFAAINMSLGFGKFTAPCSSASPSISTAIGQLHDLGIAVVAASGNSVSPSSPNAISMPACVPGSIAVGSETPSRSAVSSFSNASAQVALLAQGEHVLSSFPGGNFAFLSGTSMATPAVAGTFALLREIDPAEPVDTLTARLRAVGHLVPDLRVQPSPTYPDLDAAAALARFGAAPPSLPGSPPTTSPPTTPPPAPSPPAVPGFTGLSAPARLVDTRDGRGGSRLAAGGILPVQVTGVAGVPASGVAAVSVNLTAVGAGAPGYLSVYPCGGGLPQVSNVNYDGPTPVANKAVVPVDASGRVCVLSLAAADVVIDIDGWFAVGEPFGAVAPHRVLDTRSGMQPGTDVTATVAPAGAAGAVVNVTITEPAGAGFATIYPCGGAVPLASNLNFLGGQTVPGAALVAVDGGGHVCVHTNVPAHVIVDVDGTLTHGFTAVTPYRVVDTRDGTGGVRGRSTDLSVQTQAPLGALGVALNVTVTNPSAAGFVTVFPCGPAPPLASSVNFTAGQTVANAVLATPGTGGLVCIHALVPTDVVVDVDGWVS